MNKTETTPPNVVKTLNNEIYELSCNSEFLPIVVEKARILIDDISQCFFDEYDPNDKKDLDYIQAYFKQYRTKTDIFLDYFWQIEEKANELCDRLCHIHNVLREVNQNGKDTH